MKEVSMRNRGFTLIEMVVVLAVVAILVAILAPQIVKHLRDAKITRAINEEQVIAASINMLYKDTGKWVCTNTNGPTGRVDRVETGDGTVHAPTGVAAGSRAGAANWGALGTPKYIGDYLYYNNPDDDSGRNNTSQPGQDYISTGEYSWKGPYIEKEFYLDPWGNPYVISARYFPGTAVATGHRVLINSAGPDGVWSTALSDSVTRYSTPDDRPFGRYENGDDDIGYVILTYK
jgi:prepilin-type N-terminal cleavage/methylation domain-containing protein